MAIQEIFICMDDSGKLTNHEKYAAYGGIVFFTKNEKDKFITQYRQIIKKIKCSECNHNNINCDNVCPEIKNARIKNAGNKRWIMNYIKKYAMFCLVIDNSRITKYIMESKSSKGRYLDYAQKMLVKKIFLDMINQGKINPYKPVKLTMYIDEQTTKSNGYYNLRESIREEFLHGIINFDYGIVYRPILHSSFKIDIHYVDSKKNYIVQAADFVVGEARSLCLNNNENIIQDILHNYTYIKFLP